LQPKCCRSKSTIPIVSSYQQVYHNFLLCQHLLKKNDKPCYYTLKRLAAHAPKPLRNPPIGCLSKWMTVTCEYTRISLGVPYFDQVQRHCAHRNHKLKSNVYLVNFSLIYLPMAECYNSIHQRSKMFDTAVADVLFYSYIYLSIATGCSLKTTAPTYPFKRAALHSGYLGLLLICGVIELKLTGLLLASTESQSFNHCGQYEVNLHSPNHLLCSIELPLRYYLSVGSLMSKFQSVFDKLLLCKQMQILCFQRIHLFFYDFAFCSVICFLPFYHKRTVLLAILFNGEFFGYVVCAKCIQCKCQYDCC